MTHPHHYQNVAAHYYSVVHWYYLKLFDRHAVGCTVCASSLAKMSCFDMGSVLVDEKHRLDETALQPERKRMHGAAAVLVTSSIDPS